MRRRPATTGGTGSPRHRSGRRRSRTATGAQPRALTEAERQAILDVLHCDRFVDLAPAEVWATLLDEGVYLGSMSTIYRLLRQAGGTRERRRQATHPATVKPELVATAPNQVWSWDITKLRGPAKWTYFYLYVILDIFSRYVVGWMVATRESAALAEVLIRQTVAKQGIGRDQLTIHADRGSLDDLQAGRVPARRPRRHPVPLPAARLQRQPVQRGAVQDAEVPARLPRPVRLDRGRPGALRRRSSPGTTTSTATPGSACTPPPTSTTASPRPSATSAPASSTPPTPPTPNGSSASRPQPPKLPTTAWINPPDQPRRPLSKYRLEPCLRQVDRFRLVLDTTRDYQPQARCEQ